MSWLGGKTKRPDAFARRLARPRTEARVVPEGVRLTTTCSGCRRVVDPDGHDCNGPAPECQRCHRTEYVGPWLEPGTYTLLCVLCKLEACGLALADLVDATDTLAVQDIVLPVDTL